MSDEEGMETVWRSSSPRCPPGRHAARSEPGERRNVPALAPSLDRRRTVSCPGSVKGCPKGRRQAPLTGSGRLRQWSAPGWEGGNRPLTVNFMASRWSAGGWRGGPARACPHSLCQGDRARCQAHQYGLRRHRRPVHASLRHRPALGLRTGRHYCKDTAASGFGVASCGKWSSASS
jgi:hypothetical protein